MTPLTRAALERLIEKWRERPFRGGVECADELAALLAAEGQAPASAETACRHEYRAHGQGTTAGMYWQCDLCGNRPPVGAELFQQTHPTDPPSREALAARLTVHVCERAANAFINDLWGMTTGGDLREDRIGTAAAAMRAVLLDALTDGATP